MTRPEDPIQAEIVKWYNNTFCLVHHVPRQIMFSVPNGGLRNKLEALKLKATGLLPGVSDLIIIHNGITHFIEVKKEDGTQQPNQIDFQKRVINQGFNYFIVHSLDEFKLLTIFGLKNEA